MNSIINYLIELNLGLVLFFLAYWLLLKKEHQFSKKRIFLLTAILVSIVFPLVSFTGSGSKIIPTLSGTIPAHWLPEIIITTESNAGTDFSSSTILNIWNWLTLLYGVVAIILILILMIRVMKIVALLSTAYKYPWKSYTVAESDKVMGIFSFFKFIFLSRSHGLDTSEKEEVLKHEEVHIKKLHSLDIILINLLEAICWFNPVIRFYKNTLVQLHEFEADARSVESMDVDRYCGLLAKVALQQNGYVLANHFTNSFTLKRINMIRTFKKKISQWKVVSAFLVLSAYFFMVACQDQIMSEITESTMSQVEFPAIVKNDIATKYQARFPGAKFNYIEGDADEIRQKFASHTGIKQILLNTYEIADRNMVGVLTADISHLELKDQNEVYSVVEETAKPKSGMEKFYQYIASNLKYPSEARSRGIEGKAFIEFVVNEDGSLSDIRPIKGIGAGCDEEAVRIIAQAEPWEPGRQRGIPVKQRLVIPIIFRLDNAGAPAGELQEIKKSMRVDGKLVQENGNYFIVGKVVNTEGNPLPGMNIVLAGTSSGTVSDMNGNYKLEVSQKGGTLVFSFVGYNTESLKF